MRGGGWQQPALIGWISHNPTLVSIASLLCRLSHLDATASQYNFLPKHNNATMGKRKAAKKPQGKKRNEPLATTFSCLFCNHEKSVTVKIDKKGGVGQLACKVCDQKFQCGVNYLSAAVDVYSEWVDACDAVAKDGGPDDDLAPSRQSGADRGASGRDRERGSDNDIIDDDDLDGGDGYGGDGIVADDEY